MSYQLPGIVDRVAIVTGHRSGIGAAVFNLLQEQGAKVYGMDLPEYDLAKTTQIESYVNSIAKKAGKIDILINNAGATFVGDVLATTVSDVDHVLAVNLKAPLFMIKAVLPMMLQQKRGAIVNNASDQAFIGKRYSSIYGASKAALAQLTKSVALDVAETGIRVNCVAPGSTDTPMLKKVIAELHKSCPQSFPTTSESFYRDHVPLKRFAEPLEIAWAIVFLASDAASFITATVLSVDGGVVAQ